MDPRLVDDEFVYNAIREVLAEFDVDPQQVVPSASLEHELGLDSLDRLAAMLELETRLGVSLTGLDGMGTVAEAVDYVRSRAEVQSDPRSGAKS